MELRSLVIRITMTDTNLISTLQFAAFAPEVSTSQYTDPTLSGLIGMASKMVSDYLLFTPVAEVIVDEVRNGKVDTHGDLIIMPVKIPVISVQGIKLNKATTDLTLNLTDGAGNNRFNIDYNARIIRYPQAQINVSGGGFIISDFFNLRNTQFYTKLSYTAGFQAYALPATIQLATVLLTRELLARQFNQTGATKLSQGGISMEFAQNSDESDLVRDAKRLLRPYRRIT